MPSIWGETIAEHRALVRERLLDAFAALVRERGIEATTLAAVAERAGIARSAVYNHVRDKHALVLAHAQRAMGEAVARLAEALEPSLPPAERLARYVEGAFRSFSDEPAAGMDLLASLDPEQQQELLAMLRPVQEMLHAIVTDGLADGTFAGGSAEELARFVAAVVDGHRHALAHGHLQPEEAARTCTALLLHGLTGPR